MKKLSVSSEYAGERLDTWLTGQCPEHSRARWQSLIKAGHVLVDGQQQKPHHKLTGSEQVVFDIPEPESPQLLPEDLPLDVLYEDEDLIVVNKPPNLVVHPAPGHNSGTLVNALLFHCKDLAGIGGEIRPGIVHRLDKDTSGVLVAAKNETAMNSLTAQFKERRVHKEYIALVWGRPAPPAGTIETLVGRNPHNRKKMSATPRAGRKAVTRYSTMKTFSDASLLRVVIETGRTHQIRVHMSHIGHPVVGDRQYGRARKHEPTVPASRQMLHAERLAFSHPRTGKQMEFTAPLPEDMLEVIKGMGAGC